MNTAARETLDRAALAAEPPFGGGRADALAWLAEARTKAGDAAQDIFARALSIAHALPNDFQRALVQRFRSSNHIEGPVQTGVSFMVGPFHMIGFKESMY